jgi:hypothetical protein
MKATQLPLEFRGVPLVVIIEECNVRRSGSTNAAVACRTSTTVPIVFEVTDPAIGRVPRHDASSRLTIWSPGFVVVDNDKLP